MKQILIIGIGAGNPDYLTIQAVNALNRADVFFVMDKGIAKERLVAQRKQIIERFYWQTPALLPAATSTCRVATAIPLSGACH